MNNNLSYKELKGLSDEEKKEILIKLKEKYASYKEMAEKIGGTPLALSNMYLRVVEGKKFGRNKKEKTETINAAKEEIIELSPGYQEIIQSRSHMPSVRKPSFTIGLDIEATSEEAGDRIQGIIGALMKENKYKILLRVEEV